MRDFMININDNVNALDGFAPRAETEAAMKNLERKINNLFKMQMQGALI
jgi:hypothetical protein